MQTPTGVTATFGGSIPGPNINTYTSGSNKYVVVIGNSGPSGSLLDGTVTFNI
jgi:hypothetical protein